MFAEIEIDEPLDKIAGDWDFLSDRVIKHFSGFKPVGHNIYGLRRRVITQQGMTDPKKGKLNRILEINSGKLIDRHNEPLTFRLTPAGNPHRVMHNFGYWHINDKDELYLPIPAELADDLGYYVVIMGLPKGREIDSLAWYCEQCNTLLYDHVIETYRTGIAGFWKGEREAVNIYNGDLSLRTCPDCHHENPLGYCWNSAKDTAQEAAARLYW